MKMLREWNGTSNEPLLSVLKQFGIEPQKISLSKYEALSPDSFIWSITVEVNKHSSSYYIYAEDFVDSLEQVTNAIGQNLCSWTPNDKVELVSVTKQTEWEKSEPVQAADQYTTPKNPSELMKYAAQSGYDFVFLAKVIN